MSNVRKIQEAVERAQQAEADKKAEVSKQIEATKADFEKRRADSERAERIQTAQKWRELQIAGQERQIDSKQGAYRRSWLFDNPGADPVEFDGIWPEMRRELAEKAARAALL